MKYQTFFYFTTILSVVKCLVDDKGHDLNDDQHHNCTSTVEDNVNHLDDNSSRDHCVITSTSSSTSEITHSINDQQTSSSILHFPIIPSLLFTILVL